MEEIRLIDKIEEAHAIRRVIKDIKNNNKIEIESYNTLVLNVSPSYSSIFSQNVIHALGDKDPLDMVPVYTPVSEGETYKGYELKFISDFKDLYDYYEQFIICKTISTTGNNLDWLKKSLIEDFSIPIDSILIATLYEHQDSIVKGDIVGEIITSPIKFTWEK